MATFTYDRYRKDNPYAAIEFVVINCSTCKGLFALMRCHIERLHDSKETFYCPSGHAQCYTESTEEKLRRQLEEKEREIQRAANLRLAAEQEAELALKREQLAVGETRRLMTRITSGICPCCSRFFKNVARHMETQHPGIVAEHKPFAMTERERSALAAHPTWNEAKECRRRFVKAHAGLSDHEIAQLMIDGKLYASPHVPTVARAVANIRKSL